MNENNNPFYYFEIFSPKEISKINNIELEVAREFADSIRKKNKLIVDVINFSKKNEDKKGYKKEEIKLDKKEEIKLEYISLNSKQLNSLLGGGFQNNKLYLIFGKFATGKSQICHHLCVSAQNKYKNLEDKINIIFIDTEDTFRPKRLLQINKNYKLKEVLSSIKVIKIQSSENLKLIIKKLEENDVENLKLIIIDSFTNIIRLELGNNKISNIKVKNNLISILKSLRNIANNLKIPIILTSQVKSVGKSSSGFNIKSIMEHILNEFVEEIILLSRSELGNRFAYLINSTILPEKNVEFDISDEGIIDI